MDSGKITRLCRQLRSQIDTLENQCGVEQAASAAAMGSALIRVASEASVEDVDSANFGATYSCFLGLCADLQAFFKNAADGYEAATGTARFQEAAQQVEEGKEKCEELRRLIAHAREEKLTLNDAVRSLRAEYEESRRELQSVKGEHDELLSKMATCSPDAVAAQRDLNEHLVEELASAEEELRVLEEERDMNIARLERLNEKIASVPEENRALLKSCQAKDGYLRDLEEAQEACSPEVQAEIEREIERLRPEVEELTSATHVLRERLKDLEGQHLEYDRERQTLETDILEKAGAALRALGDVTVDHENALAEVSCRAQQLEDRIAKCDEARRRYCDWLDADINPLERMIAALERPEAQKLRDTMDVGTLREVQSLRETVEEGLTRLDEIIALCSRAARLDRADLEQRARR